jgi:hypothetical protein
MHIQRQVRKNKADSSASADKGPRP